MVIVQLVPAAKLFAQLLESLKLFALIPFIAILEMSNVPLPVLDKVTS